ncbi:MAG: ECF transporter S component [Bacteroidaceae bacterium]|nr:ECF transporter S component [Bacteroidaceae bacterium]
MDRTVKLYSLQYSDIKTYLMALIFIAGNIILPQLCHLVPQGGITWLPIYFFTLIGAYKYGWKVGLLTAVLSPLANSAFFAMPAPAVLPAILLKSVSLALAAAFIAHKTQKLSILCMLAAVLAYQLFGTLGEWAMTGSLSAALQDFRLGIPGMLMQIFGGHLLLRKM